MEFLQHYNYYVFIVLMMAGFYLLLSARNLIKKVIGLNLFQTAVFVFYISTGVVEGGAVPIQAEGIELYSNPLPHTLILTAIVVGVASTALGLSLILRIKDEYGTIEEDEVDAQDVLS
ncbi:MAG: cation:proton antiporter subunit C [Planctomycetota bacterium]